MSQTRRDRRNRRLLLIGGVFLFLVLGVFGLWLFRTSQDDRGPGQPAGRGP